MMRTRTAVADVGPSINRVALWAGLAGVLISMLLYSYVGLDALRHPLNQSAFDGKWALFYTSVFAVIGLLFTVQRGRWILGLTLLFLAAYIVVTVIAGRALTLAVLFWIILLSAGLGDRCLRLIAPSIVPGRAERIALATLAGLGGLGLITLAIAALGGLYTPLVYAVLALLSWVAVPSFTGFLLPAAKDIVGSWRARWRGSDLRFAALLLSGAVACLSGALIWAQAPALRHDSMYYHLGVPAKYLQYHGLVELPEMVHSYWCHTGEMLYTLALVLVGQPLPNFVHMAFGILTAVLIFCLGQRLAGTRAGLVGAVLYLALPLVAWESGIAYVDLIAAAFTFAAVYCAVVWWLDRSAGWLTIAGVMAGFALGTKLDTAFVVAPLCLLIGAGIAWRFRASLQSLLVLLRYGGALLITAGPYFFRDWWWTGNPIFPYYNNLFHSPKYPWQNGFGIFQQIGVAHGVIGFLRIPWDLTVHAEAYYEACPPALLGALPLLALPWLYLWYFKDFRRIIAVLFALVISSQIVWFNAVPSVTYALPFVPALAVLAALNLEAVWLGLSKTKFRKPVLVLASLFALAIFTGSTFAHTVWGWPIEDRYPLRVALGTESYQSFLSRSVRVYDAYGFIDREYPGVHNVISIGNEFRLYTRSRIFGLGSFQVGADVGALPPGPSLAEHLRKRGYEFMVVDQAHLDARPGLARLPVLNKVFLQQFATLEFARPGVYVYRFREGNTGNIQTAQENLLANPGFEDTGDGQTMPGWIAYGYPTIDRTGTRAHSGKCAVKVNGQNGFYQRIPVEAAKLYTLGYWSRADRPQQAARLQINWSNSSTTIIDVSIQLVAEDSEWKWNQMSVTSPSGAAMANVYASVHENSEVWLDDFKFTKGAVALSEN